MIIHEQPSTAAFSRSPIRYLVNDTNYSQAKFEYIAEVWVWQGTTAQKPTDPVTELRVPPRYEYGNGVFDVRTIVTDFFVNQPKTFPAATDIFGMYSWIEVSFGFIYEDAISGEYVIQKGLATSGMINVLNGYTYPLEGINYYPNDHMGDSPGASWMTDRPQSWSMPYATDDNGTVIETNAWMFIRKESGLPDVDNIRIQHFANKVGYDYDIPLVDDGVVFQAIGVGSAQLRGLFTHPIGPGDVITIHGSKTGSPATPVTVQYTVNVVNACAYGFRNMQFLNRYGVWDNIYFWGNRSMDLMVDRGEVLFSPLEVGAETLTFNPADGQYKMTSVGGREMETWNTGWVREEWNEMFKQLMLTSRMFESDLGVAYTHGGRSFMYKTERLAKVINYTFRFNPAYTVINTI